MRYVAACLLLMLTACPTTTTTEGTYTIGGTVSGFDGTLILANNNADPLTVKQPGRFQFATGMKTGDHYSVSVVTQPTGFNCTVAGGSGVVGSGNVSTIAVTCVAKQAIGNYVGGNLSGLAADAGTVVLQQGAQQGSETLSLTSNGNFKFPTKVAPNAVYTVTVVSAPTGYICSVANASGTIASSDITNVAVTCVLPAYTISGAVSAATGIVVLSNNGGQQVQVDPTVDPTFEFDGIQATSLYDIEVVQSPNGQTCVPNSTNHQGKMGNANVTNVLFQCGATTYIVSGSVTGQTDDLTVANNTGSSSTSSSVTVNKAASGFAFPGLPNGSAYSVSITTPPTGQKCTISGDPSGNINSANVSNIQVSCQTVQTYTLTGSIAGATGNVLLHSGNANTVVAAGGTFNFTALDDTDYSVTVVTPPPGQYCSVSDNGSGHIHGGNVSGIVVTCGTLSVSGTITGNANGLILGVNKNGTVTRVPVLGTATTFSYAGYVPNDVWQLAVYASPQGLTCSVGGPTPGTILQNVTGVTVTCVPAQYPLLVDATWNSHAPASDCNDITVHWVQNANSGDVVFPCASYNPSFLGIRNSLGPFNDGATVQLSVTQQPTSSVVCVFAPTDTYVINHGEIGGARVVCEPQQCCDPQKCAGD